MKGSNLLIGIGIGLLLGAVAGIYFTSDEEERAEYLDEIGSKVDRAKQKIGDAVNEGLAELEKAGDRVSRRAQDAISRVRAHHI